jgi:hypothetical protein
MEREAQGGIQPLWRDVAAAHEKEPMHAMVMSGLFFLGGGGGGVKPAGGGGGKKEEGCNICRYY